MKLHSKRFLIVGAILLILVWDKNLSHAQPREGRVIEVEDSPLTTLPVKRKFFSLAFDLTAGITSESDFKNPLGLSMSLMFCPVKRDKPNRFYMGPLISLVGDVEKQSIDVPDAWNGNMETNYGSIFVGLSSRYYFLSSKQFFPFIDFDLGWRFNQNYLDTDYNWSAPLLGVVPGGDEVYSNTSDQFAISATAGCFFQLLGVRGLFVKAGVATGSKLEVINFESLRYSSRSSYEYTTTQTASIFFTMSLGLML
jgi:hypothetical protein